MVNRVERAGLAVATELATFIETQALPGTEVSAPDFWAGFAGIVNDLGPKNRALLVERAKIQA